VNILSELQHNILGQTALKCQSNVFEHLQQLMLSSAAYPAIDRILQKQLSMQTTDYSPNRRQLIGDIPRLSSGSIMGTPCQAADFTGRKVPEKPTPSSAWPRRPCSCCSMGWT
jgi:hypothetical protein